VVGCEARMCGADLATRVDIIAKEGEHWRGRVDLGEHKFGRGNVEIRKIMGA